MYFCHMYIFTVEQVIPMKLSNCVAQCLQCPLVQGQCESGSSPHRTIGEF